MTMNETTEELFNRLLGREFDFSRAAEMLGELRRRFKEFELQHLRRIIYRGSVTDLATDVAYELDAEKARELIQELERFMRVEPSKFRDDYRMRLLPKSGEP